MKFLYYANIVAFFVNVGCFLLQPNALSLVSAVFCVVAINALGENV